MDNTPEKRISNPKWYFSLGIILILIIAIGGLFFGKKDKNSSQKSQENIKVGVIGHLSGKYAEYGIPMKNAVELAVDEINKKGGINDKKVELIVEDDNSDPNSAASAMNKLVNVDNLSYIISVQGSGIASAISPIAQNNKKIFMITLGSAPGMTEIGDYVFQSIVSDVYQATKMVDFINNNLGSKKVAGLYLNDSYGVGIKKIIVGNEKVENVDSEMFESAGTDFKTQLLKIKESGADTLVVVAHDEYPMILKQINELGLKVKIIASETFKDEKILKNSGSLAEGVRVTFMSDQKDFVGFSDSYQTKFNEKPFAYATYAYDGMMSLAKSIGASSSENSDDVKKTLLDVNFDGASGKVSFSKNRERLGTEYTVYVVRNGQFIEEK